MPEPRPRLSVIVPTREGWPAIERDIALLQEQLREVNGELIVLDASGLPAPVLSDHVRWLEQPVDLSVFQLRERGYRLATAEIVAVTEDHCRISRGWCQRILALHAAHPEAIAIGGAVANGSRDSNIDWAAYLVTQVPYAAPLDDGPASRLTSAANLSLKRKVVDRLPHNDGFGTIELFDQAGLCQPGEIFWLDSSLIVFHELSLGFRGTSVIEFHNGRVLGGFRRRTMSPSDWARVFGMPLLVVYRIVRTMRIALGKQVPRAAMRAAAPAIAWLHLCAAAGELLGYATGPGNSPQQLR